MNDTLTWSQILNLTKDGRIFSAVFVKRTNLEIRYMVCRRGVKKGVKGIGLSFDPLLYHLLSVYDMQKMDLDLLIWI